MPVKRTVFFVEICGLIFASLRVLAGVFREPAGQASYSKQFPYSDYCAFRSAVGVRPRDHGANDPCSNMLPFGQPHIPTAFVALIKPICCLALVYVQSRNYSKKGDLYSAKKFGMYAAILDVLALVTAFMVAVVATTITIVFLFLVVLFSS